MQVYYLFAGFAMHVYIFKMSECFIILTVIISIKIMMHLFL